MTTAQVTKNLARSPENDAKVVAMFLEGLGVYKIARDMPMGDRTVRLILKDHNLSRPKAEKKPKYVPKALRKVTESRDQL